MTYLYMGKEKRGCLLLQVSLRMYQQRNHCDFSDVSFPAILAIRLAVSWNSSLRWVHDWAMYILGLCSSWGTSRICPAWSPSEHLLTPLCPHLGPRLKPNHPEEVVYSLNDSCSHFTQRLFPPKVPQRHTRIISYST